MMMKIVKFLRRPKWRFGAYSVLVMSILIAIGVLTNIVIDSLETAYGWRRDYSFNGYTATGEETQAALDTLTEPVTLYLLYSGGDMDSQLYEVLLKYRQLNPLIIVKPIDLVRNPGFVTLFEGDLQSSVTADSVVVSCETTGNYRILDYSDFLTQGYNIETGEFEIEGLAYEKSVTEAIVYVSQTDVPMIGISQGHGELSTDTLATLIEFLKSNSYDVETVDLLSGDTLDGIDLLLIADPYKDFTAGEIETMKAFARNGGSFFVIRDYTDPLDLTNYQSLLRSYGVVPLAGVAVASEEDAGSYYGERIYLLPYFNSLDMTVPLIQSGMDVLLLVGACAFEPPEQTDASLSAVTVLKSGKNAYLRDPSTADGSIEYQEGDLRGELTLAVLAARMHSDGTVSRMFAIGNSTVFTDEYIYQRTFNQQFIMQLMGELLPQKTVTLNIIAKTALHPGLTVQSAAPAIALLAALPALILLLALYVLLPRRNR
ncbi:MAG: Gldg family protein [Clostridiales bacterium]|nr:Gldg family protein [Clostridiales bacterium]